jgi:predicted nucleic acid-binding protein
MPLADTLLRLAEQGLFQPFWSKTILEEAQRSLEGFGHPAFIIQRRIDVMERHFPGAMLASVPGLTFSAGLPDANDEHVLETAVRSDAQAIVTSNLKHFPAKLCKEYGINFLSPDAFLVNQFDLNPDRICEILDRQASDLQNPTVTVTRLLDGLRRDAPECRASR